MINRLAISGYRSLRNVVIDLGALTVVTGANGSGKSSLYRALRLLSDIAQGRIIASLAAEGGLASTLWAGSEKFSRDMKSGARPVQGTVRAQSISLKLGFASDDYGYTIDLGLPMPSASRFTQDPEIKVEAVWAGETLGRANLFAERRGPAARLRDSASGTWRESSAGLSTLDSIMPIGPIAATDSSCCCCANACGAGASTTICAPTATHPRAGRRSEPIHRY